MREELAQGRRARGGGRLPAGRDRGLARRRGERGRSRDGARARGAARRARPTSASSARAWLVRGGSGARTSADTGDMRVERPWRRGDTRRPSPAATATPSPRGRARARRGATRWRPQARARRLLRRIPARRGRCCLIAARPVVASVRRGQHGDDRLRRLPRPGDALLQRVPLRRGAGDARHPAGHRDHPALAARSAAGLRTSRCSAPREIGQEGFREGKVDRERAEDAHRGRQGARRDRSPSSSPRPSSPPAAATRPRVKDFLAQCEEALQAHRLGAAAELGRRRRRGPRAATRAPSRRATPSRTARPTAPFAYYRLPGPAGHKSRYEDPAIEKLGEIALGGEEQGRHVRLHERRHVRRRQALEEGDEALDRGSRSETAASEPCDAGVLPCVRMEPV